MKSEMEALLGVLRAVCSDILFLLFLPFPSLPPLINIV